jgi:hypothetical protein
MDGSHEICPSKCVWISTHPGVTKRFEQSITRSALVLGMRSLPSRAEILAILLPAIATSPMNARFNVPSTISPLVSRSEKGADIVLSVCEKPHKFA